MITGWSAAILPISLPLLTDLPRWGTGGEEHLRFSASAFTVLTPLHYSIMLFQKSVTLHCFLFLWNGGEGGGGYLAFISVLGRLSERKLHVLGLFFLRCDG